MADDDTVMEVLEAEDEGDRQNLMIKRNNANIKQLNTDIHGEGGVIDKLEAIQAKQDKYLGPIIKIFTIIASAFALAVSGVLTLYFTGKMNAIVTAITPTQ